LCIFFLYGANIEHLPAALASPHVNLKAIYSRSKKSVDAVLIDSDASVDIYSDDSDKSLDQLLARQDIDAVIVALPITIQPVVVKKALIAGKHVLSEKPIAGTVKSGQELIDFYRNGKHSALWGVAENFRYVPTFETAVKESAKLGKITTFNLSMGGFVKPGDKYYETEWRKIPDYQGGFLLDGGVHFVAGLRKLLGEKISEIVGFSRLNFNYLAPVDTINGLARTESGVSGTISISFASTKGGYDNTIQYEKGYITVSPQSVTVAVTGEDAVTEAYTGSGVHEEVDAFARGILAGKLDSAQQPEEALVDVSLIQALLESDGTIKKL
jgi:predicted dehydrogenase